MQLVQSLSLFQHGEEAAVVGSAAGVEDSDE